MVQTPAGAGPFGPAVEKLKARHYAVFLLGFTATMAPMVRFR